MYLSGMLRDIWTFRTFVLGSVKREFRARYAGTQFGFLWALLQPLSMILIYTLVFSNLMKSSLPGHTSKFAYSIYLCSGIITWGLFSDILGRGVGVFVHNSNLLKKVSFPKLTLPVIIILSTLLSFGIIFSIFMGFLIVTGNLPGIPLFATLPVLMILVGFSIGLGVLFGTINVFYRDVEQSISIMLQFWFWLTPVVYVPTALPTFITDILQWNPLWPIIIAMQTIFLQRRFPDWNTLLYPATLSVLFLLVGLTAFRRLNSEIVDEL